MFEFIDVKYRDIVELPHLSIELNKITVLIGASGSGKTTILKMLNKMISPTQGRILYHGQDLSLLPSVAHRRKVIMLSQTPVMFAETVRDNLNVGLRLQERDLVNDVELYSYLDQVQLKKSLDDRAANLSGGEKQRLALARILILDPEVFIFDEPSSAQDQITEEMIIQMLSDYTKSRNKTIVMASHSRLVADHYAERIIEIEGGRAIDRS